MAYRDYHHDAYKAASYREESKTRQVVLLYEGALRYAKQAKEAIEKSDIETRYNSLTKACEILTGLQLSLDFKEGGEVAQLLYDYYAGLDQRLTSLHFNQDMAICDACIRHLTMMKEAWEDVHKQTEESGGGEEELIRNTLSTLASQGKLEASGYASLPELATINVSA